MERGGWTEGMAQVPGLEGKTMKRHSPLLRPIVSLLFLVSLGCGGQKENAPLVAAQDRKVPLEDRISAARRLTRRIDPRCAHGLSQDCRAIGICLRWTIYESWRKSVTQVIADKLQTLYDKPHAVPPFFDTAIEIALERIRRRCPAIEIVLNLHVPAGARVRAAVAWTEKGSRAPGRSWRVSCPATGTRVQATRSKSLALSATPRRSNN